MKHKRHQKIIEIIENNIIITQEELANELNSAGFNVTQATVSRDIKDLRLIKSTSTEGISRYVFQKESTNFVSERLLTVLKQAYIACELAQNIIVIKTLPGMAQAAASALDQLNLGRIVGTLAGDDTIMVICKTNEDANDSFTYFKEELRG